MLDKFKIGHYTDNKKGTGATVILAEEGAIAGCSIRGSSPATRETDLLKDGKTVQKINAVVLSGGSAFGLEASSGVMDWLFKNNCGYNAGKYNVPIVVGASLYDLEYKDFAYPDKNAGFYACENATIDNFIGGNVGAGTGATISKILGVESAIKAGLGVQKYTINDVEIAVIVAVNALGDIKKNGEIVAGALCEDGTYLDCQKVFSMGNIEPTNSNTTIGVIITNAIMTKEQANILADLAHDGFALALSPSHTRYDGDAMFVMSSNSKNISFNALTAIIPQLTEKAIQSSVIDASPINKRVNKLVFKLVNRFLN